MHPSLDVGVTSTMRLPKAEGGYGGVMRFHKADYEMMGIFSNHQVKEILKTFK